MHLEMEVIIALLTKVAEASEERAVAENVLIVARLEDGRTQREIVRAVADGLGVPLA